MKNKNILIIVHELTNGGAERVGAHLSEILSDYYNVYLAVFNDKKIDYPYKGNLICLDAEGANNFFVKAFRYFIRLYKLRKIKKDYKIDVTISLLETVNFLNVLSRVKDKVIITHHNVMSLDLNRMKKIGRIATKALMKIFDNKADKIVGVSKHVIVDLAKNFDLQKNKLSYIYNSFDIKEIQQKFSEETEDKYKLIFNYPIIINIGRLTKQKGQKNLLKVFNNIKNTNNDAKLIFLGVGELKEELLDISKKFDLKVYDSENETSENIENFDVYFLGYQKNPYKFMRKSSVFAFPSNYEGFGNVIIEAMACGLPVISSDCLAGPREILTGEADYSQKLNHASFEKYGVLMPVFENDSKQNDVWTEVLIDFLNNKDNIKENYAKLSLERAKDFDHEKIKEEWINIINM